MTLDLSDLDATIAEVCRNMVAAERDDDITAYRRYADGLDVLVRLREVACGSNR